MGEQIAPDIKFVREVIAAGGESLKKCYQCATCSVVCNLTPDNKPFPRKEMIYAQWGLKDKLISSPDIWLCHQCSDCTAYCPRGAKPGEVLGAIRSIAIKNYSKPAFIANLVGEPKAVILLFAIPIAIFLFFMAIQGHFTTGIPRGEGGIISFSRFMPPIPFIDFLFIPLAALVVIVFIIGIKDYWRDMSKYHGKPTEGDINKSITDTIVEILSHKRFDNCNVTKDRKLAHLLVFYSFIGLAITTAIAVFYLYVLKWESPYPQTNIIKIIGNISGIALLVGITMVVSNRIKNKEKAGIGSYFDWLFIVIVYGVGLTGMFAQIFRLLDIAAIAYFMYFSHLVFIFALFAYAPYSKMAHMVYRTTAMVFARHTGRDKIIT
ncbi:MAG: quinone-interacting membrane-bound oxidoreductase complex subunit QmoC [Thermodesulfovibrionales bacterium]|nr:quinone-interacting membrane-bound oxidoreductase complex subunit QmoC [Thermodesulfovibrionales bacterium]